MYTDTEKRVGIMKKALYNIYTIVFIQTFVWVIDKKESLI